MGSTTGPLAGGTPLEQPLLGATTGRAPGQTVVPVIRLIGGDTSQNAMQASDFSESDDGDAAGAGLLQSIIILAKAIVGAGSAALPFAFARLGLVVSISFLYVVAFMTHYR